MSFRWRGWARFLPVIVLLGLIGSAAAARGQILRAVGWALVVDEPVGPADVIVLPQWAGSEGALDAADLVLRKIASRVAVLAEPPKPAEQELIRRGIPFQDEAAGLVQLLRRLGVTEIERIPTRAGGTDAEAQVLSAWCEQHRFHSIVVVSSPDHSRRVRRTLHRSLRDHPMSVVIRAARYSSFDPDRWWETRENIRTAVFELQKLLLDVMRHPIS
jgi:hypothetical protein